MGLGAPEGPAAVCRACEVEQVSDRHMRRLQTLTHRYMVEASTFDEAAAARDLDEFATSLQELLEPYNVLTQSLLLKRVERTIGRHVCAFFKECAHGCRYAAGGYGWADERLLWKPLDLSAVARRSRSRSPPSPASSRSSRSGDAWDFDDAYLSLPTGAAEPRDAPSPTAVTSPQLRAAPAELPFTRIPIVDFGEFIHGGAGQQREVAAQIGDACAHVGFMYLVNHGIPNELVDRVFRLAEELFELPAAEKRALGYAPGGARGYFGYGTENLDQTGANSQRGDRKEGYDLGVEESSLPPRASASAAFHAPNRWPAAELGRAFRKTMGQYTSALRALATRLTEAFALSLGLPVEFFHQMIDAPCCTLRLNHYPAPPPERRGKPGEGCGAHSDYGLFTILAQDKVGGLQVRNSAGEWVSATPLEGSFVINIGDMLSRWTNGRYASTIHRVVDASRGSAARLSVPFFFNPNADAEVACLATCTDKSNPPRHPPATAEAILAARYAKAFEGSTEFGAPRPVSGEGRGGRGAATQ